MQLEIEAESGLPLPVKGYAYTLDDQRVAAAVVATFGLEDKQVEENPSPADKMLARNIMAGVPTGVSPSAASPGALAHLRTLLTEYDREIIGTAAQLRNYIVNRLLELTDTGAPHTRLKALELLGKVGDVGLFVERSEVTHKSLPATELEARLRAKLTRLLSRADPAAADIEFKDVTVDPEKDLGL